MEDTSRSLFFLIPDEFCLENSVEPVQLAIEKLANQDQQCFTMLIQYSKTCLKRPLKKDQKLAFETDYHLMQVKMLFWRILQYF